MGLSNQLEAGTLEDIALSPAQVRNTKESDVKKFEFYRRQARCINCFKLLYLLRKKVKNDIATCVCKCNKCHYFGSLILYHYFLGEK